MTFVRPKLFLLVIAAIQGFACCPVAAQWFGEESRRRQFFSDGREPFGAEDFGSEDNIPSIPEPMVFDLVRGLGADRGEFEVNVLSLFPVNRSRATSATSFDPFGPAAGSLDRGGIEWAPEVEYALCDGFAVEFELPFEGSELEAYKFAAQLTFGTAFNDKFIHGGQTIVEPHTDFEIWELTFLYLAGVELSDRWSALGMIGVRPQISNHSGGDPVDGILNLTIFADVTHRMTCGLESNFVFGESDRTSLLLMPQVDVEITDHLELQCGIGPGFSAFDTEVLAGLRLIYSR